MEFFRVGIKFSGMRTFYAIFGGKLIGWIVLLCTLSTFAQLSAQPCSNPPVMTLTGNATICESQTTNISFNISGGTAPWRLTYSINGVVQPEINNIFSSPYVLSTGTAGYYAGMSVYDNDNCLGTISGLGVNIIVNPLPAAAGTISGISTLCSNQLGLLYSVGTIQNALTYEWQIPAGFTVNGSATGNIINLNATAAASSGIIRVRGVNGCGTGAFSPDFAVTVTPAVIASAGSNGTLCQGNSFALSQSLATNYSTLFWSTSGDGSFDNLTILHPTYTPGMADITNGSVTLTLTATGNGVCSNVISSLILTIIEQPTVNAGPDITICEDTQANLTASATNYQVLQWSTSGNGTFTNPASLNTNYLPGPADIANGNVTLTLTALGGGICGFTATDDLLLNITQRPNVEAGANMFSCGTGPVEINGIASNYSSIVWTSTGNGTFLDPNSLNTLYFPGQSNISSGSSVLTLTAIPLSPCAGNVSDQFTVTLGLGPTVDAGPDDVNCGTNSYYLAGSSADNYSSASWSTTGTGTFFNPTDLNATYIPSPEDVIAGSVTLVLTVYGKDDCITETAIDEMVLYINPDPIANAGQPALVCEGSSLIITDATASFYSAIYWTTSGTGVFVNNGTLSPTYIPSANDISNGLVTLTLTASPLVPCMQAATSSKVITFSLIPTVFAGSDGIICNNAAYSISNASASDYSSVIWTTSGSGTFTSATSVNTNYLPSDNDVISGSVTLTLTAYGDVVCNLSASDSQILTIISSPVINAGENGIICENSTFTVTTATAINYSSILWTSNGSGVLANASSLNPSYTASHNDAMVGSVTLTMSVTGISPCSATISDAILLNITPHPVAIAGNDQIICADTPLVITGASAVNYSSIIWTTSGTGTFDDNGFLNPIYTPSPADIINGSVILTLTANPLSPCTNPSSDNIVLTISHTATVDAGSDYTICIGSYQITTATASNYSSLTWITSGTGTFLNPNTLNPTYTPSALDIINGSVNLTIIAQSESPCTAQAVDNMVLTLPGNAVVDAGTDGLVCEGSSFQVTMATASNYGSLNWSTSGTGVFSGQNTLNAVYTPSISDITLGSVVLTLTATTIAPCNNSVSDQMTLTVVRAPQANAGADQTVCEGISATLSGTVQYSSMFVWSTAGDGVFLNGSTLTPTYVPGSADIAAGSATITLISYTTGVCTTTASDNVIVNIRKKPVIYAGIDVTICDNNYTIETSTATNYSSILWTTSGTGIFINPTFIHATYIASLYDISQGSVTLTLTGSGNSPCIGTVSDNMTLIFTPTPTVYAGADASTCGNNSYSLVDATATNYSAITWTTSGTGTFSNSGDLNPTYYPSAQDYISGYITLTLTATGFNLCNITASDQMTLSLNTQPVGNAGPDMTSCGILPIQINGASASNYSSILWTHNGTGTIQGSTGINPVYTPSQADILAGQVTLTLHLTANLPCTNEVTDDMTISLEQGPVVSVGSDVTICAYENLVLSNATATGYSTLAWTTNGSGTFSNNNILNPVYYPSINDISSGSVTLTLTVTGASPCNSVVGDFMILTINAAPIANAGPDASACASSHELTQASAQNYSSVMWTTSGSGNFTDPTIVNAVYTPSNADILAGSVILTLTVNGQSPCNTQVADDMILFMQELNSLASAGSDGSTCGTAPFTVTTATASINSTITWTTSGSGTFVNQNTLTPTYTPSTGDATLGYVILIMQVQGSAPCFNNAQDDMTLTILAPSKVNAGLDAQVCDGSNHTISGASATNYSAITWSTSGTGTFVSGNTLTPTYMPSAADYIAGSVVLTLSSIPQSPCTGIVSDAMLLTFVDAPTANAGADATICFGLTFTVTDASTTGSTSISWTSTGSGTLVNTNTLSPTYIPSAGDQLAGSVILTMTVNGAAPCLGTASDAMVLTINSVPLGVPVITGPQVVCAGEAGIVYSVTPPVLNATDYSWVLPAGATIVAGDNTATITVDFSTSSTSGNISVTPSNNCGNGSTGTLAVTVNPAAPDPGSITGPTEICINSTGIQYSVTAVTGATDYQWTVPAGATIASGNGTNTILVDFTGTAVSGDITVSITNSCGTGSPSILAVTVLPLPAQPVITANGPTTFCNGENVILSATPGYATYTWSNGMTTPSITVTVSGTYSVVVTDLAGCSSIPSNDITVTVNAPVTPVITANGPLTFCEGGSVTLTASAGYVSYLWSNGQTTQSIIVTQSGTYTVTAVDLSGCPSMASLPVNIIVLTAPPAPVITANGPTSFCFGSSVVLSAPIGYASYLWSNGEITQSITVTTSGDYYVQVTDISGCSSLASNIISVSVTDPPLADAGEDATICVGSSYLVSTATASNYTTILWTSNGTGTLSNPNTLNPTYIPSLGDIAVGAVTLTMSVSNPGCPAVTDYMIITIQSGEILVNAGPDGASCEGGSFFITDATAVLYNTLLWTTSGTGFFSDPTTLNPIYTPSPSDIAAGSVVLTLTGTSSSTCYGSATDALTLFIRQEPQAYAGTDGSICEGVQYVIIDATAANYSELVWTTSGSGFFVNGTTLTPTYVPSQLDYNSGSVVLTLIASNAPCADFIDSQTLTITPSAVANAGPDVTVCQTCSYTVSGAFVNNAMSYAWSTTGTGTFTNTNTLTPTYVPSPQDITNGTVTLNLSAESFMGCGSVSDQMVITINQSTLADFTWEGICLGQPTNFFVDETLTPPGSIAVWHWNFGDGFYSNEMNPVHVFAATGLYTVTLTTSDTLGNLSMASHIVEIQSIPTSFFSIETPNCSGNETQFINLSSTENGYITRWVWDYGDGSPTDTVLFPNNPNVTHTYAAQGTYAVTLTVTSSFGCDDTHSAQITILPSPIANFHFSATCEDVLVAFQDASSSNGPSNIVSWNWNFGDPGSGILNYSDITNPQHAYATPGTYDVTLIVVNINSCSDTIVKQISVGVAPPVAFTWQGSCANTAASFFTDPSVVNLNAIADFLWEFGDGGQSTIQDPQHIYTSAGNYMVTLTITDTAGCSNSISNLVTVSSAPVAYFSYSEPTCLGDEMQFTDLSSSSTGYVTTWEWNFGDGNIVVVNYPDDPDISHLFVNPGVYNVTLAITTSLGCEHLVMRTVNVLPSPIANFTFDGACLDQAMFFNDLSQPNGGGQIINWAWDFGDPASGTANYSTLSNPSHIYNQPGTYTVTLNITTSNTCIAAATKTVVIAPAPVIEFAFTSGCAADTVSFTSSTFVNINSTISWLWNFGDGTTSAIADPDHIYAASGVYNVSLTIIDTAGCSSSIMHPVSVIPGPEALFAFSAPACTGSDVQFTDMSTAVGSPIITWHWDFGDGNEITINAPGSPNVTHTYLNAGVFTVTLTITNLSGCDAVTSNDITIAIGPTSGFSYAAACEDSPVEFTDLTTTNGGASIIQWLWNFGDPASGTSNTSYLQNPVHTYTSGGTFTVTLTAVSVSGCQDISSQQVIIATPPAVAFTYSTVCEGQPVLFEPDQNAMNVADIASWLWDFGDGTPTSDLINPTHTYTTFGTYTVTLTVTSLNGCTNATSQIITVAASPVAAFTANSACSGNISYFTDQSYTVTGDAIVAWDWAFGDPNALNGTGNSNLQNPEYYYSVPGVYDVSLTVTSSSGCSSTVIIPVEVIAAPVAAYSYITNACLNGTVTFVDESTSALGSMNAWSWEFEPYYYSNLQNPVHTFPETDSCYNVTLIVTDKRSCTDTVTQQICIPAALEVAIDNSITCLGDTTSFSPVLIAPANGSLVSYSWNFDDLTSGFFNTSTLSNPVHYFANIGTYLVSLTATDENNCQTTVYKNVEVKELPYPRFSSVSGSCDSTIYLTDYSISNNSDIVTWIWDFGDGTSDTLHTGPGNTAHYYQTTGAFEITLTVINAAGCSNSMTVTAINLPCITSGFIQLGIISCERQSLTFEDHSFCGIPINDWTWYFGDGNSLSYTDYQPTVSHFYETGGVYNVSLVVSTVTMGITIADTLTQTITVLASPQADFTVADTCVNSSTLFNDISQIAGSRIETWSWDFGDQTSVADISSIPNPVYQYPSTGMYQPTLIVTNENGCSDTLVKNIVIHNIPVADFSFSIACQKNTTYFTDLSDASEAPIDKWWWRIKDSVDMIGLAGVPNPQFTFEDVGNYDVELIVVDENGCRANVSKNIIVNPKPTSAFSMTNNYENTQGRVLFTNGSIGATAYEWNFGIDFVSFEIDPVVNFPSDGEYEISLISLNEFDCPDTLTMDYSLLFKGLYIPNAFSPNNPNPEVRRFKPIGINLQYFMVEVYDTWGNILWTSNALDEKGSPAEGWDGVYQDNLLPQDTYLWKATAVFKDGSIWNGDNVGDSSKMPETTYGTVYLIR